MTEGSHRRSRHFLRRAWFVAWIIVDALLAYIVLFSVATLLVESPAESDSGAIAGQMRGAFHVHSTWSDGRGTAEEIATAAQEAGIQFVVVTDHNIDTVPAPRFEKEVLLIFGVELSTPSGHVVALGIPRGLGEEERRVDPIDRVHALGGLTVVAHPIQKKRPWTDWQAARRADGMELYSADSMLREAFRHPFGRLLPAVGAFLARPNQGLMVLVEPQPEALLRLLEISTDRAKAALCALDAHGIPPYATEFRALSMYLPLHPEWVTGWPADPAIAARQVILDLAGGYAYCGFRPLGDPSGFRIEGLDGNSRQARAGERLRVMLPDHAPPQAKVRVWGSGSLEPDGRSILLAGSGPVQIEVWLPAAGKLLGASWKPWIVASPIWVNPT